MTLLYCPTGQWAAVNQPRSPGRRGCGQAPGLSQGSLTWDRLIRLLEGKEAIWGYNADFDRLALVASARRYQLTLPTWLVAAERWRCAMSLYREWMGWDWDVSLERACAHEGIPAGWHTAELDARSTLALLRVLAGLEEET
ncbi:3'-5' exonuclease [Thermogemmatispora tikiterensis]|uniref:Exonuclease domain-containing protein n=1 Tax=Thermogemmatispora tikiterensis TaxID=1825093 RepID=A0A328VML5_9CHLR|nr:hypothetical protein [Thermogemmatispora tikiterensis]RAQ97482.1 hypothetical protein A4R35_18230 [Thermogemmatispora tikiterensis]